MRRRGVDAEAQGRERDGVYDCRGRRVRVPGVLREAGKTMAILRGSDSDGRRTRRRGGRKGRQGEEGGNERRR